MQRLASIVLVIVFAAILLLPGVLQFGMEYSGGAPVRVLEVFDRVPTIDSLRDFERRLADASVVGKVVRPPYQYAQFRLFRDLGGRVIEGDGGCLFYRPGIEALTQRRQSPSSSPADAASAIIDFHHQLQSRGIRLLVLPIPNKESIYPEQLTRRAQGRTVVVAESTAQLLDRLRSAAVEVVDLFAVFGQAKQSPQRAGELYLKQDTHWSPIGVELTARTVAEKLIQNGWIRRGDVLYDRQPVSVQRVGDLLEMLRVPAIEQAFGRETIECTRVVERDGGAAYENVPPSGRAAAQLGATAPVPESLPLVAQFHAERTRPSRSAEPSEILLLGDSFARIFEQDEPGQAGLIAHLAALLQQHLAAIVNDGGASTLVRQQLARQPELLKGKKLVIWEFVERDICQATEGWQQIDL